MSLLILDNSTVRHVQKNIDMQQIKPLVQICYETTVTMLATVVNQWASCIIHKAHPMHTLRGAQHL
jgi:hypothetical protein